MKNALKAIGILLCVATLSACAVSPTAVEQTVVTSMLDPTLVFERTTIADKQGTTTWDITQVNKETVKAVKHNKASTAEQDNLQTFIGTATAPLMNGVVAHSLKNRSSDCGSNGCGGGGQQVMQLQVETNAGSSSQSGGCTTCALLD